jgi:hypothetical protein
MTPLRFSSRSLPAATRRRIAALALLAVLARALIPSGFMPVAGDGAMRLVVCDGTMHHHPAPDGGHPGRQPTHESPCPFAASAGPGLLPLLPMLSFAAATSAETRSIPEFSLPSEIPPRHRAPRGPPAIV